MSEDSRDGFCINPHIWYGDKPPRDFLSITGLPLFIITGLTGTGKTSLLEEVFPENAGYHILPNRRAVMDAAIIGPSLEGETPGEIDRLRRFDIARHFRAEHPGGMAYCLSRLSIKESYLGKKVIVFDNLRGREEISFALTAFPRAFFISLYASPLVRLKRLLYRKDSFDRVQKDNEKKLETIEAIPGKLCTLIPRETMRKEFDRDMYDLTEITGMLQIIHKESTNYNAEETNRLLQKESPERSIIIDTDSLSLDKVSAIIKEGIKNYTLTSN